jgi:uncharacterized damage-inducible protein DinB
MVSDLTDAFAHHAWANDVLLGVCEELTEEQLATPVPGTYGPILDMLRHIVGADDWYLYVLSGATRHRIDEDTMSIPRLRDAARRNADDFRTILGQGRDPREDVTIAEEGGNVWHATLGVRLAQVVHHGTDHRSQICTGLTALGIEPPEIDVWAYGEQAGLVRDAPPEG